MGSQIGTFRVQGWALKGHEISLFILEKSWNVKVQKEHKPC